MTMDAFLPQIVYTAISIMVILIIRVIFRGIVIRFSKKYEKLEQRTRLIIKHINISSIALLVLLMIIIWGIDFRDLGLVVSSIFAVIGVAFFAQWSILSNATSGIIMFFTFPFKIGDRIKIHDKEFTDSILTIEDIRTFQMILRAENGELLTYPNSMVLQKGITMVSASTIDDEKPEENKNIAENID